MRCPCSAPACPDRARRDPGPAGARMPRARAAPATSTGLGMISSRVAADLRRAGPKIGGNRRADGDDGVSGGEARSFSREVAAHVGNHRQRQRPERSDCEAGCNASSSPPSTRGRAMCHCGCKSDRTSNRRASSRERCRRPAGGDGARLRSPGGRSRRAGRGPDRSARAR